MTPAENPPAGETLDPTPAPLVLVTGATRGLGLAISARLLADGYRVVASGRTPSDAFLALQSAHPQALAFMPLDLQDTTALHGYVRAVVAAHGPIYALVNNAAVGHDGVLATMHDSQVAQMLRVNVEAPILLAKYCARSMLLQRCGRIVNVGSIIAGTGFSGLSVYAASKAALAGFTRSLARELGRAGITVNTLAPGYMETEMTAGLQGDKLQAIRRRSPSGELARVEDAAAAVAYLLSADAERVTGTTLTVDAGSTA
jgi:3-oxoacyl-[acyl-carrier protein] reductase